MLSKAITPSQLLIVFIASTIPRIIGAILLPNAFGDAYAYTEQTYYLRRALLDGSFSVSSLFGFWLPLYQFVCAGVSAVVGNTFYVPKIISAVCGGGICVLVCVLTWELTGSKWITWVATVIVAVNPYHIFYSSAAMTDVPHAFFILLCAYSCIKRRWWIASVFAVGAGLMRIESWTLIPLIPVAHFLTGSHDARRRGWRFVKSTVLFLFLAIGPLFWLYVSWKATGSALEYFRIRNHYIVETLATTPSLARFSTSRVAFDLLRLNYIVNPLVLFGVIALGLREWSNSTGSSRVGDFLFSLRKGDSGFHTTPTVQGCQKDPNTSAVRPLESLHRLRRKNLRAKLSEWFFLWFRKLLTTPQGLMLTIFCSHLAFLLFAYATNNQPEIWPRYGLIFFVMGLPMLATHYSRGRRNVWPKKPKQLLGRRAFYVTVLLFAVQFCVQLIDVTRMTVRSDPNQTVAEFLEDQRNTDRTLKVYCDDGAIRVLSGIPLEEFRNQYNSPADENAFIQSLKEHQVRFVVYKDVAGSPLRTVIHDLRLGRVHSGITLEEVIPTPRKQPKDNVVLYRVHDAEMASVRVQPTRPKSQRPRVTEEAEAH